jgi:hypothetical protein
MMLAGALALGLHLCLLAFLAMRAAPMPVRLYGEDSLQVALVAPIYLPRRAKSPPPSARTPRALISSMAPLPMAPVESPTALAKPFPAPPMAGQALAGDIGAMLRRRLDCARTERGSLTQGERQACDDALGRGAQTELVLGQTLPAEKRAYYDAVMAARKSAGHIPGFGCRILFGGGKPASVVVPAHGLKLGPLPCFVTPPAGSLTPEADIPSPY